MAYLEGHGKPHKQIEAAIGDIYTDIDSGKKYKCVWSYAISGEKFDTQWTEMKMDSNTGVSNHEEIAKENESNTIDETSENVTPVKAENTEDNNKPERKNYTNYSKKK